VSFLPVVTVTANASGAYKAAEQGDVVVIVDVIDMSTTLEALLEAGAIKAFGACPDGVKVPVPVNPKVIGLAAGELAVKKGTGVVVVAEPRSGTYEERKRRCLTLLEGIEEAGAPIFDILPNIGAETARFIDFEDRVVVAVTDSGGAAFDVAFNAGADVFTATVARTLGMKGREPARVGVQRACLCAREKGKNIAVVAASSNAVEDLLAAQYIMNLIVKEGFLHLSGG